jgi:hypothetical protein
MQSPEADRLRAVTTSWDDGDPKDCRLAELLQAHGVAGTFYVPIEPYHGRERLEDRDLRALHAEGFEIGAHSVSHKDLSRISHADLVHEVRDCKEILEQAVGEQVLMFCYPNGRYHGAAVEQVRKAGYSGARSTRMLSVATTFDAFEMPTTVQAYPHKGLAYVRNQGRARSISGLSKYIFEWQRLERWVDLGKALFDQVVSRGGIWHLYGHSWEIEELGMWGELTEMLEYVAGREGMSYVTNGKLSSIMRGPEGHQV